MYHKAVEAYFDGRYKDCTLYTLDYLFTRDDIDVLVFGGDSLFKIKAVKEDGSEVDFPVSDGESMYEGCLICDSKKCWTLIEGKKEEVGSYPEALFTYLGKKGIKGLYMPPHSMMSSLVWRKIKEEKEKK